VDRETYEDPDVIPEELFIVIVVSPSE